MSKEEFIALIDASFNKGTPLWIYTNDYIYGMIPSDGNRWIEVTYELQETGEEERLVKSEKSADFAYQLLLEEITKGLAFYIEDLNVNKIKDFAKILQTKSGSEKINDLIGEIMINSKKYSGNLPIIKNKSELHILKNKL
jgi:hypothetical protein